MEHTRRQRVQISAPNQSPNSIAAPPRRTQQSIKSMYASRCDWSLNVNPSNWSQSQSLNQSINQSMNQSIYASRCDRSLNVNPSNWSRSTDTGATARGWSVTQCTNAPTHARTHAHTRACTHERTHARDQSQHKRRRSHAPESTTASRVNSTSKLRVSPALCARHVARVRNVAPARHVTRA